MSVIACVDADPCLEVGSVTEALGLGGAMLVVTLPPELFVESGPITVGAGRDVTLVALGGVASLTTTGPGPVFDVRDGGALRLVDVSAMKLGNRVFALDGGILEVTGGVYYSIGLVGDGGVLTATGGAVTLTGARFLSSISAGDGGLVAVFDTTLTATGTAFRGGFAQSGGAVWIGEGAADATFTDCVFEDNEAIVTGGAIAAVGAGELRVEGTRLSANRAASGGAVALLPNGVARQAVLDGSAFDGNRAEDAGGALSAVGRRVLLTDSALSGNEAARGGAVAADGGLELDGDLLCANVASGSGGALELSGDALQRVRHTRFVDNEGASGGAVAVAPGAQLDLRYASFLGNRAERGAAVQIAGPGVVDDALTASAVLVAGARGDAAVRVESVTAAITLDRVLFWDNPSGHVSGRVLTDPLFVADPQLRTWVSGTPCDEIDDGYSPRSPLVDGGRPDDRDPDGTRADLGAWGGMGRRDPVPEVWTDPDGDGVVTLYDCDPESTDVYPVIDGLPDPEIPYDGIDQNCDGWSDDDADRDGWDRAQDCDDTDPRQNPGASDEPGVDLDCDDFVDGDFDGFAPPEDCDDGNADANPDAVEDADLTVDADCDGFVEPAGSLVPRRCDSTGGPGVGALASLVAAVWGRRRRNGRRS